jgi:hypothetical protein
MAESEPRRYQDMEVASDWETHTALQAGKNGMEQVTVTVPSKAREARLDAEKRERMVAAARKQVEEALPPEW